MSESKLPLVTKIITQQHLPYIDTKSFEIHPCFGTSDINKWNRVVLIKENFFLHLSTRTRKDPNPLFFGLAIVKISFCPRKNLDTISKRQVPCPVCRGISASLEAAASSAASRTHRDSRGVGYRLTSHQGSTTKANLLFVPTLPEMWTKAWCISVQEPGIFGSKLNQTPGVLLKTLICWTRLMLAWRKSCWNMCSVGLGPLHQPFLPTNLPFLSCITS